MEKFSKKDLAAFLAEKECCESKAAAERLVTCIFEKIACKVTGGCEVAIPGFGKFMMVERKAREGVNPQTGKKIHIPATMAVKFKVSKKFKDQCSNK